MAKSSFYRNIISDLKLTKPSQWYSSVKRLTSYDQQKNIFLNIANISHLTEQQQTELQINLHPPRMNH